MAGAVDLYIVGGWLTARSESLTSLELFAGVHTAEEANRVGYVCWRVSRGDSTDDWVGGGDADSLDRGAWLLFAILFLWQFPHFHAIAWMYREDYARAGILMLPVVDREGTRTFRQIILYAAALVGSEFIAYGDGTGGDSLLFRRDGGEHSAACKFACGRLARKPTCAPSG